MPKRSIRTHFLAERKATPTEACIGSSVEIQSRFLQSDFYREAACLALYSAIHNEVLTDEVANRTVDAGKTLAYPRVDGDELVFVKVETQADLVPGAFGVLEPQGDNLLPIDDLDLVIVPGVAFDQDGHRLGYGRGFYDRALTRCRKDCVKVGFAYDFQLTETLPSAEHDETLSVLMTEVRTLNWSHG